MANEEKKSKFAVVDKNGETVYVTREDFMIVYKKMITDSAKKVKL